MFDRRLFVFGAAAGLTGCTGASMMPDFASRAPAPSVDPTPTATIRPASNPIGSRTLSKPNYSSIYGEYPGERFPILAFEQYVDLDPVFLRQSVEFTRPEAPGSIVIDPASRHLYYIESHGVATRYGVGVGREGFLWSGAAKIKFKRDWPDWVPPTEMVQRQPEIREKLEPIAGRGLGVPGGPKSPLGARAMYLWDDVKDLGYRIHGTTEPDTIGSNVSSGCIRMINQDIAHLYARVSQGTPVTVLG
jgi:lipoprotein-anchoring transpeptidase ErfK/SrfK